MSNNHSLCKIATITWGPIRGQVSYEWDGGVEKRSKSRQMNRTRKIFITQDETKCHHSRFVIKLKSTDTDIDRELEAEG